MIGRFMMLVGAVSLTATMPAIAAEKAPKPKKEKWATKIIADKPQPVTINPKKSYILVRSTAQITPVMMRLPDAEQAAAHEVDRREAFDRAHRKWRKQVEVIELDTRKRRKPPEPTEASFGYPSYEQKHTVFLGPQNRFSKVDGSVYLQEVPPGEYIFYAVGATCACLGTISFDAPAGKVVALDIASMNNPDGTAPFDIRPANIVDTRLPAESVLAATFKPAGMRANWFGISVDRVLPVEGVFTYERGKQVAGGAAAIVTSAPEVPASEPVAGQP